MEDTPIPNGRSFSRFCGSLSSHCIMSSSTLVHGLNTFFNIVGEPGRRYTKGLFIGTHAETSLPVDVPWGNRGIPEPSAWVTFETETAYAVPFRSRRLTHLPGVALPFIYHIFFEPQIGGDVNELLSQAIADCSPEHVPLTGNILVVIFDLNGNAIPVQDSQITLLEALVVFSFCDSRLRTRMLNRSP
ncbi:hypothetical protein CONPUDRAFT_167425 [Coniophora puteana RWD-64-598 SS2]|uniref:Uncharacterized protein n=1 Tax=Coniophora puteana (strain RWD-64-598) TaxID=741705 RepID=A0A5M3MGP3_CONPW|nr:uncharacterized protein CONPUDRAFT_167425 [Coniophora puteana RWD-64-598 SS2]EIW78408.1 hypothetical protein CONPUDRAFT_167425 [Coniophora puteana RWD-64-598 SS2]